MLPYFPRDAVLAVIALGLVVVMVDVLAGNKTQSRTFYASDCAAAYKRAKTYKDTLVVDRRMYKIDTRYHQHCAYTRVATR
jgi:hypothetical protein